MGTPFPGPPFLHSGVPRPQRVPFFRGNARSYTGNIVYPWERKFSNELVNVNLVKTWPDYKYKEPVAKVKGAHIFLQGARVYGIVEFNVPINTV